MNCSSTTNPLPKHFKLFVGQHWHIGIKMWPSWHLKSHRRPNFQFSFSLLPQISCVQTEFLPCLSAIWLSFRCDIFKTPVFIKQFPRNSEVIYPIIYYLFSLYLFYCWCTSFVTIYVTPCLHSRKIQNHCCWKWNVCPMWKLHAVTLN